LLFLAGFGFVGLVGGAGIWSGFSSTFFSSTGAGSAAGGAACTFGADALAVCTAPTSFTS
jgi:hypothetical protein